MKSATTERGVCFMEHASFSGDTATQELSTNFMEGVCAEQQLVTFGDIA